MSRAPVYLALALLGLALQLVIFAIFLGEHGLDLGEMGEQAVDTTIAVLALADLLLTATVVLLWMPAEARRVGIDSWWRFALAAAGGVCFALPLFLWARERRLEGRPAAVSGR
jgi:hypothetical protein